MRATELEINIDEISRNARLVREALPRNVKMLGVVKADAYGHDAVRTARCLLKQGAYMLAVAIPEEAMTLRDAGIRCPVLVLGRTDDGMIRDCIRRDVSMAAFDPETLEKVSGAARDLGVRAKCHLKCDTGMSRIGVRGDEAMERMLNAWRGTDSVEMEGFFTHFCVADTDPEFTALQNHRFERGLAMAKAAGFDPIAHAAASTAMLNPAYQHDMVRAGITLYGSCTPGLPVRNAQTLRTRPVRIERVSAGDTVGYGRTYRFERDSVVITLPIGYGDGYPRALSNRADVLVHGRRARIAGNVCMDMLMVDVTDIPGISMDDEVVLMGAQGGERITPDELAERSGTIPYEIMLGFSPRIRRTYLGGEEQ